LWVAVFATVQFFSLADFGIQDAVTQRIAEIRATDVRDRQATLSTAFWLSGAVAAVAAAVGFVWPLVARPYRHAAHVVGVRPETIVLVLIAGALGTVLVQPLKVYYTAEVGAERGYVTYGLQTISSLVGTAGVVVIALLRVATILN